MTQYLAPRAYVFVAKEGTAFFKAGKLAYNFVSQRVMDIVALAHYGDLAMFACKILIAVISAVVGYPAIFIKVWLKNQFVLQYLILKILLILKFNFANFLKISDRPAIFSTNFLNYWWNFCIFYCSLRLNAY